MTPRERLQTVLVGQIPDCVPCAPDFSNMIPARMTGKKFWELYLYNNPPIWDAYISAANHFDIDSLMDGYFPFVWPSDEQEGPPVERFIVHRDEDKIVTRWSYMEDGKRKWRDGADVFYAADPPTENVKLDKLSLPAVPEKFEPVEGVREVDLGVEGLKRLKKMMGDRGLVGVFIIKSQLVRCEDDIYKMHDEPEFFEELALARIKTVERRFADLMKMSPEDRPDFLCVGGSGTLVFQTEEMFRKYAFPAVKRAIELASAEGIPTHVHSCGPETKLVQIFAEETDLTVIDPLEPSPMGDCDLAELKRLYGDKIILKGNLHTTEVMLRGSRDDVVSAAKIAIDSAAKGGKFMLSTADQCGRDTPDENIHAMVETARTYGKY